MDASKRCGRERDKGYSASIFGVASIAFSGYVTLAPALFLGVRWRRFTAAGAVASIAVANVVYWAALAEWFPLLGFLPVFWAFVAGCVAAWAVSRLTPAPRAENTSRAFGDAIEC